MSLTDKMRDYIIKNNTCTYKQMKEDLDLDDETAKKHFMELFEEGFCKAMPVEGELRIFRDLRNSTSEVSKNE